MHSIRLPIERLSAMCFSSLLISEMLSSDPCLYVFVMLSCKSLLYVSSEVSYMFLVLSAKTKILSDELIFFKSFAKFSWKWFLVSRNLMFSKSFKTSSSKGFNSKMVGDVLLDERPK